jgi:hypothetical protein
MKRLVLVALCAATAACRTDSPGATGPPPTDFFGELAPHGEWLSLAPYGAVWRPADAVVGVDFYPYFTGGRWEHTEHGWSWRSDWSWGWIPFHHGRWVASTQGWVWVPGDEWAPAWVEWRVGGGHIGWVPLGPQGVSTAFPGYRPRWCFVPLPMFTSSHFHEARVPAHREYAAYHAATAIPFKHGDWRRGPSVELIRRAGGAVTPVPSGPPRALRRGDVRAEPRVRSLSKAPRPPDAQARRPVAPPGARAPSAPLRVGPMPPPPNAPAPAEP